MQKYRILSHTWSFSFYHAVFACVFVPAIKAKFPKRVFATLMEFDYATFDAGPREANAVQHGVVCFPYRKLSVPPDALGKGRCRWVEHDTLNAVSVRECL